MRGTTHIVGGIASSLIVVQATKNMLLTQVKENPVPKEGFFAFAQNYVKYIPEIKGIDKDLIFPFILIIFFGILGALFVDIDSVESKIGRRTRIISDLINSICGHRGLFHSMFLYLIIYIGAFFAYKHFADPSQYYLYACMNIGFFAGAVSHLILDTFTKMGVPWLMPFQSKKISFSEIRSGSAKEIKVVFVLWVCIIIQSAFIINLVKF